MWLAAHEKKLIILYRLTLDDRVMLAPPGTEGWQVCFLNQNRDVTISVVKWLRDEGLIVQSIAPIARGDLETDRKRYQAAGWSIFSITDAGRGWLERFGRTEGRASTRTAGGVA
jgi:hypothetical protein